MLGNLGFGEVLVIVVLGLLVFGPEKLPALARDASRVMGELRRMADGARTELREQLGPEAAEIADMAMDPRRAMRAAVLEPSAGSPTRSPDALPVKRPGPGEPAPFDPDAT